MQKNIHRESIARVLAHIDTNRESDLDLEILAQIAHVSKFHFHRLFKEHMGISLGQYIKLKRLESGMWKLIYTENKTLDIALDSGYENHAAFTRAFSKEMGCSPKEFKENFYQTKQLALNQMQKSAPKFVGYQTIANIDVFYIRKTGSYFLSALAAWREVMNDLTQNKLIAEQQTFYGISQDDPNLVDKDDICFDLCIEASAAVKQKEASLIASKGQILGGGFAVFLHQGPLEKLSDSYHYLYGKWIFDNDVILRDVRPFIKYLNPFADVEEKARETEIYIPIT